MDTLNTIPATGTNWDTFYIIAAVLVGLYEVVIRFIPTLGDYTIIGFIYRILDFIVENRAKPEPENQEEPEAAAEPKVFKIFKKSKKRK